VKEEARSVGSHLASLSWVAIRSFAGTVFALTLAGVVLAILSYAFLGRYHWSYGVIAAALALVESVTLGFVLGAKRALVLATAHGLGSLQLGRKSVRMVFDRVLGAADGDTSGGGSRIARGLERLPLAQADKLLNRSVQAIMGDTAQSGWLRRKIQVRLLGAVRRYTLARFREEGAGHDGIDLLRVKEDLERTVDDALVRKLSGGLRLWMALALVGLPCLVAAQVWITILLLGPKA
jgi:hypothetical protein